MDLTHYGCPFINQTGISVEEGCEMNKRGIINTTCLLEGIIPDKNYKKEALNNINRQNHPYP